jgi:hypothetical protein
MFIFLGILAVALPLLSLLWGTSVRAGQAEAEKWVYEQTLRAILKLNGSTTCGQATALEQAQQIAAEALNISSKRS